MQVHEWLQTSTADDVMSRSVVVFQETDSVAQAAAAFLETQISGAPVVDNDGHCVGVFTVTDVLLADQKVASAVAEVAESSLFKSHLALPASLYEEKLAQVRDRITPASEQPIAHFMTTDVVSVTPATPLINIVADMVNAHIHRVVVVDETGQPQGLISTTDVLAALLRE